MIPSKSQTPKPNRSQMLPKKVYSREFKLETQAKDCCIIRVRGSQYASHNYQQLLRSRGIRVSMSRNGDCYDNALIESFFSTLKSECVTSVYSTRAEARQSIFEFIGMWCNRQRRHSALSYCSPEAFEKSHFESTRESFKLG